MSNTLKRRSILPAWWWITLTGLLSIASLSTIIPYLNDMVIYISSEWDIGRINKISLLCHCATIGLLLLPLFVKSIYLNKPVRIGLISCVAGYILYGFLWFIHFFYYIYIYSLVENVIWILCIFSWLYLLWNIGAHWTLKVTLTSSLLISKVIIPLLLYGSIFEHFDFFPHNISVAINDFMAFSATLLIVLIAQPKQPVPATDEPTQIE